MGISIIDKNGKLYKALEALNEENIKALFDIDKEEVVFSDEHNRRIQEMIEERFLHC